jgi:hypothetical protein
MHKIELYIEDLLGNLYVYELFQDDNDKEYILTLLQKK